MLSRALKEHRGQKLRRRFVVVFMVTMVCAAAGGDEAPLAEHQEGSSYQRQALLNRIEFLSERVRHYSDLEQGGLMAQPNFELFNGLAGSIAVSLMNGAVLAGISRVLSPLMASQGSAISQGAVYSLYSGISLVMAWQLLHNTGWGRTLPPSKHVQYALESVGVGQLLGLAGWLLGSLVRPTSGLSGPEYFGTLLNRAQVLPNYNIFSLNPLDWEQWWRYNRATYYVMGTFLGNLWYYLSRTLVESSLAKDEFHEQADELAVSRMLLHRLQRAMPKVAADVKPFSEDDAAEEQ